MQEYLSISQAGHFLHLAKGTLAKLRVRGDGPPFIKIGKTILYDKADLIEWLSARKFSSTSQYQTCYVASA